MAPTAAPCTRRVRDSPCRIAGASMTFTLRMRGTRTASGARTCRVRMPNASDHERLFFECHCASRWHHRYHCRERKLRYIAVFLGSWGKHYLPNNEQMGCRTPNRNGKPTNHAPIGCLTSFAVSTGKTADAPECVRLPYPQAVAYPHRFRLLKSAVAFPCK